MIAAWAVHPFEAMSSPVRRRIVELLASGECTSGQIAEHMSHEFRISRTATSKHLRILRDAGFVEVRAELSWRWYYLTTPGIARLEKEVEHLRMMWARRIGWDSEHHEKFDPLAVPPEYASVVPRKGAGRKPVSRGRGRQAEVFIVVEPDHGLCPAS